MVSGDEKKYLIKAMDDHEGKAVHANETTVRAQCNDILLGLDLNAPDPRVSLTYFPNKISFSGPDLGLVIGP